MPPRIGKKSSHSSGFILSVIWVALLNNCWSFVNTVHSCPVCSDWDVTSFIVISIIMSGSVGLIRGIKVTWIAGWSLTPASLANLVLKSLYYRISKPFPSNFRKWKTLSLALLSDNAAFAKTCNGRIFDVTFDVGIDGFFGPWHCLIRKSSDQNEDN